MIAVQIGECIANSWMQCNGWCRGEWLLDGSLDRKPHHPGQRGVSRGRERERERERGGLKRAAGKAQHRDPRLCSNPFSKTRPPSFVFNYFNEGSDWGTLGGVGREQKQHHSCFGFYKAIPYTIINMSYIVGIRKGQEDSLTWPSHSDASYPLRN